MKRALIAVLVIAAMFTLADFGWVAIAFITDTISVNGALLVGSVGCILAILTIVVADYVFTGY